MTNRRLAGIVIALPFSLLETPAESVPLTVITTEHNQVASRQIAERRVEFVDLLLEQPPQTADQQETLVRFKDHLAQRQPSSFRRSAPQLSSEQRIDIFLAKAASSPAS